MVRLSLDHRLLGVTAVTSSVTGTHLGEQVSVHISPGKLHDGNNSLHFTKELTLGKRMWMEKEAGSRRGPL